MKNIISKKWVVIKLTLIDLKCYLFINIYVNHSIYDFDNFDLWTFISIGMSLD